MIPPNKYFMATLKKAKLRSSDLDDFFELVANLLFHILGLFMLQNTIDAIINLCYF